MRVLFVLNSVHVLFVSCDFESRNRTGGPRCEEILQHWINQSTSKFHGQNSTLEVSVQPLLPSWRARECFGKSQVTDRRRVDGPSSNNVDLDQGVNETDRLQSHKKPRSLCKYAWTETR